MCFLVRQDLSLSKKRQMKWKNSLSVESPTSPRPAGDLTPPVCPRFVPRPSLGLLCLNTLEFHNKGLVQMEVNEIPPPPCITSDGV